MKYVKVGDKNWGLDHTDEPIRLRLVKTLDKGNWSLEDIHDLSQMIERGPVIKEAIVDLLNAFKSKGE